jgi:hypothetical protein
VNFKIVLIYFVVCGFYINIRVVNVYFIIYDLFCCLC